MDSVRPLWRRPPGPLPVVFRTAALVSRRRFVALAPVPLLAFFNPTLAGHLRAGTGVAPCTP